MTNGTDPIEKVSRRTVLKTGTVAAGMFGLMAPVAANGQETETTTETSEVDRPEGVSVEVLAPPATFPDDVAVEFRIDFADGGEDGTTTPAGTTTPDGADEVRALRDASTTLIVKGTWEPGGTSGWHTHPGPVIVNVTEGELRIVYAMGDDCVAHTYAAGEAFIDTGKHPEVAVNPSNTERAVLYMTFLGVPEGGAPTVNVEPQDC